MDRAQLAEFLRIRRERLRPDDVGLPAGLRRRTPGLRREEVAGLATMSTDYYTRLEQGRGPRPSRPVLTGLARALRLSDDERAHLFRLAGEQPGPPPGPPTDVRTGVLRMLARLDVPGLVLDAKYDVLAWNPLAAALIADFSGLPPRERNLLRLRFLSGSRQQERFGEQQTVEFAREVVADLRAATGRYPDDPALAALVSGADRGQRGVRPNLGVARGRYAAEHVPDDHPPDSRTDRRDLRGTGHPRTRPARGPLHGRPGLAF